MLLPVLVFLACGGPCEKRSGRYLQSYTMKSGTCGPISQNIVDADGSGSGGGCTDTSKFSADNCTETVNVTCGATSIDGVVDWNGDASVGNGMLQYEVTGANACNGTYSVFVTRL
jgi:hypothetical protein